MHRAGYRVLMKYYSLLLLFLLSGMILAAMCTGPALPAPAPTQTPVPPVPTVTIPAPSVSSAPAATTPAAQSRPPLNTVTTIPTTRIASDNPYLENLNIRKRTFDYPIPNCLMQTAFPAVANDTTYGIHQVVPKLAIIPDDDYQTFLRKYTEGNAENTQLRTPNACRGSAAEPTWNFVKVMVVLDPTNVHASDYIITQNVWSDRKLVAQFPTTRNLVIDNQLILISYIPMKWDEVDLFDSVGITYTRL
jgi:hypothetical protein